eukprot:390484-Rhodomonas_salina.2
MVPGYPDSKNTDCYPGKLSTGKDTRLDETRHDDRCTLIYTTRYYPTQALGPAGFLCLRMRFRALTVPGVLGGSGSSRSRAGDTTVRNLQMSDLVCKYPHRYSNCQYPGSDTAL